MIHNVEFRNFKALRDVSVDLGRFTVLVGPNSSGKTSVLEGLDYLALASSETRPRRVFQSMGKPALLLTSGAEGEMSLMCCSDLGWIRLARNPDDEFSFPRLPRKIRHRITHPRGEAKHGEDINFGDGAGSVPFEIQTSGVFFVENKVRGPAVLRRGAASSSKTRSSARLCCSG
ncbi:MAG: AAA family ATPase [Planctomycetota bacterium]|jgi:predicted ATPase